MLILLVAFMLSLSWLMHPVSAQTNTTATEIRIIFENVTVYSFNATNLKFSIVNQTSGILVYSCLYEANYTEDCTRLKIEIYNDTAYMYSVDFADLDSYCNILESVCSAREFVDIANFTLVRLKIYNYDTGELISEVVIQLPYFGPSLTGYLSYLYVLIGIGALVGLSGRGSIKNIGIGFILFGIAIFVLPYLGVYIPYSYIVFALSIILGIVLLWFSGS